MSGWDYLIVTASNDRQADAYRAELDLRTRLGRIPQAKRVLVVADPGGLRVGSGGSTIACLMRVLEIELGDSPERVAGPRATREARGAQAQKSRAWRETLDRLRILIIHAGGDSKRLPAYGPCGKIFVPVPAGRRPGPPATSAGAEERGRPPVTIFDRLAPIYLGLPAPANGRGHTVITTGDVLLFFDPRRAAFTRSGITALGCLVSPEISKNHGVFIPDGRGTIRRYLQKPSVAAQGEAGAISRGRSILDLGVMSFDAEASVRMLGLAGVREAREGGRHRLAWSGPAARALETWGLDIFREIACALGADTGFAGYVEAARAAGSPWDEARLRLVYERMHGLDFSLSLLPRCRFLHFGTSRELIRSGNALRRRDRTAAAGDSVVSLNNTFRGRGRGGRIAGKESWVEGCDIGAKLNLAGRNVVVGLDVDEPLALPRGAALDVLKGADRRGRAVWFVRAYAVDDVFHKPAEKSVRDDRVGRLAGLALGEWLEALGARPEDVWGADVPPGGRQVWNGRFFPAAARASGYRDWLWMLEPRKATAAQKRAWGAADRYSFAEMAALADQEAFHARRRRIRKGDTER